jgi:hypothetical protein
MRLMDASFSAGAIVKSGAFGDVIRLSSAFFLPIAADDAAADLADFTIGEPLNCCRGRGSRAMSARQARRKVPGHQQ